MLIEPILVVNLNPQIYQVETSINVPVRYKAYEISLITDEQYTSSQDYLAISRDLKEIGDCLKSMSNLNMTLRRDQNLKDIVDVSQADFLQVFRDDKSLVDYLEGLAAYRRYRERLINGLRSPAIVLGSNISEFSDAVVKEICNARINESERKLFQNNCKFLMIEAADPNYVRFPHVCEQDTASFTFETHVMDLKATKVNPVICLGYRAEDLIDQLNKHGDHPVVGKRIRVFSEFTDTSGEKWYPLSARIGYNDSVMSPDLTPSSYPFNKLYPCAAAVYVDEKGKLQAAKRKQRKKTKAKPVSIVLDNSTLHRAVSKLSEYVACWFSDASDRWFDEVRGCGYEPLRRNYRRPKTNNKLILAMNSLILRLINLRGEKAFKLNFVAEFFQMMGYLLLVEDKTLKFNTTVRQAADAFRDRFLMPTGVRMRILSIMLMQWFYNYYGHSKKAIKESRDTFVESWSKRFFGGDRGHNYKPTFYHAAHGDAYKLMEISYVRGFMQFLADKLQIKLEEVQYGDSKSCIKFDAATYALFVEYKKSLSARKRKQGPKKTDKPVIAEASIDMNQSEPQSSGQPEQLTVDCGPSSANSQQSSECAPVSA